LTPFYLRTQTFASRRKRAALIGVDNHPSFRQIAVLTKKPVSVANGSWAYNARDKV
jgi:hypothetical protein